MFPLRFLLGDGIERGPQRFAQQFQAIETTNGGQDMRGVGALDALFFDPSTLTQALDQLLKEALYCCVGK
jgi:hypothetical protein